MNFRAGSVAVATSGSPEKLSSASGIVKNDRVLWGQFKAWSENTNDVFVGDSGISTTDGFALENDDDVGLIINPGELGGSIEACSIYFDVTTNGEKVEFAVLIA